MRRIALFTTTVLVGLLAISLGFWELLRRHAERAERNRLAILGRTLSPLVGDSARTPALLPDRKVIVAGTLDESREFLLRNRLVAGVPAVMVITPLRLPGTDTALLVNRGYVPAPDAVDPGAATWSEQDRRVFRGVLLPLPDRGDGAPITRNGRESWHALDLRMLRARMPYPIAELYLDCRARFGFGGPYCAGHGVPVPGRASTNGSGTASELCAAVVRDCHGSHRVWYHLHFEVRCTNSAEAANGER